MIESLKIQNFKRFADLDLGALSRITLIAGMNNVGKSSILEALFMFQDRFDSRMITRPIVFRGAQDSVQDAMYLFSTNFHKLNVDDALSIEGVVEGRCIRVSLRAERLRSRHKVPPRNGENSSSAEAIEDTGPTLESLKVAIDVDRKQVNSGTIYVDEGEVKLDMNHEPEKVPVAVYVGTRFQPNAETFSQWFSRVRMRGVSTELLLKAIQLVHREVQTLEIFSTGGRSAVYADIGLDRPIPVSLLGDGTVRMFHIVLAMAFAQDGIVLIDEIDTGFHYTKLPDIWSRLGDLALTLNCQLVATTHSHECLEAARRGLAEHLQPDFSYIRLDELKDGRIVPKHYSFDGFCTAIDDDKEIR